MSFHGKVVLVLGGGYGYGAKCVEELLKREVKGVVIADSGQDHVFLKQLHDQYGDEKFIFVEVDVTDKASIENSFERTIEKYGNLDILINAAALFDESQWERVIQVNLIGTATACFLAINKYFPKYKSGVDAYIVNIISISGLVPIQPAPHYTASKHGLVGLTRAYGLNKILTGNGICVMGICQGLTDIPMVQDLSSKIVYAEYISEYVLAIQKPEAVATGVMKVLENPESGSIWVVNAGAFLGLIPIATCPHYVSSKHGIVGLTRSLGMNKTITDQGIYVIGLCPGGTETQMVATSPDVVIYKKRMQEEMLQFPVQKPDAVAKSIIDLLQIADRYG
ncbi:hypothetical protein Trydic_g17806 [Trypoxylus dichotomus]